MTGHYPWLHGVTFRLPQYREKENEEPAPVDPNLPLATLSKVDSGVPYIYRFQISLDRNPSEDVEIRYEFGVDVPREMREGLAEHTLRGDGFVIITANELTATFDVRFRELLPLPHERELELVVQLSDTMASEHYRIPENSSVLEVPLTFSEH